MRWQPCPFGHTRCWLDGLEGPLAIAANRAIKRTFIDLQIIWGLPLSQITEFRVFFLSSDFVFVFFFWFVEQSKYSLVAWAGWLVGRSVDRLRDRKAFFDLILFLWPQEPADYRNRQNNKINKHSFDTFRFGWSPPLMCSLGWKSLTVPSFESESQSQSRFCLRLWLI